MWPVVVGVVAGDEVRNYGETDAELVLLTDAEARPERTVILVR